MKPYYQDNFVTIYNAPAQFLAEPNVLITDPPYGVDLGNHKGSKEKRPGYLVKKQYDVYDDTYENYQATIVPLIKEYLDSTERAAVFGYVPQVWLLPAPDVIGGFYLPAGVGRTKWGFQNLSPLFLYGCAPDLHKGAKNTIFRENSRIPDTEHPCPKPLSWMRAIVELATKKDDCVVDPFCGTGTTLRACKDMNIRSIGFEISERYCEIAARRMDQMVLDLQ